MILGDRRLARRMLSGDERAFQEFFDGHFPNLYRFVLSRVGRDPDAVVAEPQHDELAGTGIRIVADVPVRDRARLGINTNEPPGRHRFYRIQQDVHDYVAELCLIRQNRRHFVSIANPASNLLFLEQVLDQRRLEEAEEFLLEARRLMPNDSNTWYRLSECYYLQGDLEKTEEALSGALRLEPGDRHMRQNLEDLRALRRQRQSEAESGRE